MKKALILVMSSQEPPYGKMIETSKNTWDSIQVDGVETLFYVGNPVKPNGEKIIYFPIDNGLFTLAELGIMAFDWCLKNKEFDYIARVNASCYVDKKELIKHIQTLPYNDVFAGVEVVDNPRWMFGGCQFIFSRDVVEKLVQNKHLLNKTVMEDLAFSYLADALQIPWIKGIACSLNEKDNGWQCFSYGKDSIDFENFEDLKKLNHFFYRVKIDRDRNMDKYLMEKLYETLK